MKKFLPLALFTLFSTPSFAITNVCVPSSSGTFTFGVSALYWTSTLDHLDFGFFNSNIEPITLSTTPFTTVNGSYQSVDPDYDWGWSANVGYLIPCSSADINLAYTDYHQHNDDKGVLTNFSSLGAPTLAIPLPDVTISTPVGAGTTVPLPSLTNTALHADAFERFDDQVWDLSVGQRVNVGCNFQIHWFGGLRYTRLEDKLDVTYLGGGASPVDIPLGTVILAVTITDTVLSLTADIPTTERVTLKSNFDGIGPRIGMDAHLNIACGFGIIGSASTSLLVGDTDSRFNNTINTSLSATITGITGTVTPTAPITATFPGGATTFDSDEFTFEAGSRVGNEVRVVPNLEGKLGLDYVWCFCNNKRGIVFEAGYMVSHYFNAIDRLSVEDALEPEDRSRRTLDMNFSGPYFKAQVTL